MPFRPKFFAHLAMAFALLSLSFPLQIAVLYNHNVLDWILIFNKISILNIFVICSLTLNIPLLLKVSPLLKYSLPMTVFIVSWNNYIVGSYAQDFSHTITTLSSLAFCLILTPLLKQKYLALLKNPNLRWWLCAHRVQAPLQILLQPHVGNKITADVFDISETGTFIPLEHVDNLQFKVGDLTSLNLRLSQYKNIKCEAEIIRLAKAKGNYPEGMGLRFLGVQSKMKTELKEYISELT